MNTPDKIIGLLIAFILINVSITTILYSKNSGTANFISLKTTNSSALKVAIADDPNLQIQFANNNGDETINVSFNGNEGAKGTLSVYNALNELVVEFQIALKPSPDFVTINLGEFASGTYTCNLKTASASHVSHFTIN